MPISMQTRTVMSDNSQTQATFHAPSRTFEQLMISLFMNFLGFRHFLRNIFFSFLELFTDFLLSFALVNFFAIFFCVLLLLSHSFFFFLISFYQRCL